MRFTGSLGVTSNLKCSSVDTCDRREANTDVLWKTDPGQLFIRPLLVLMSAVSFEKAEPDFACLYASSITTYCSISWQNCKAVNSKTPVHLESGVCLFKEHPCLKILPP